MRDIDWDVVIEVNFLEARHAKTTVKGRLIRDRLELDDEYKETVERRVVNVEAAYRLEWPRDKTPLEAIQSVRNEAPSKEVPYPAYIGPDLFHEAYRNLRDWFRKHRYVWQDFEEDASGTLQKDVVRTSDEQEGPATANDSALRNLVLHWPPEPARLADPYTLGVFPSVIAKELYPDTNPPYVARRIDSDLTAALERLSPMVILVGPAKAGKSRTAFEATVRAMPDTTILIPRAPGALRPILDAIESTPPAEGCVIWLDEIGRYFADNSVSVADVERWARLPVPMVGIGTITAREQQLLETNQSPFARMLFEHIRQTSCEFWLDAELSGDEIAIAERLYPQVPRHLGEHLAAIDLLMRELRNGIEGRPEGVALVRAAVDLRRTSWVFNNQLAVLARVWPYYMMRFAPRLARTVPVLVSAVRWAEKPVSSSAALITFRTVKDDPAFDLTFARAWEAAAHGFDAMVEAVNYEGGLQWADFFFAAKRADWDKATPAELRALLDEMYQSRGNVPVFDVMDAIVERIDAESSFVDEMRLMYEYLPYWLKSFVDETDSYGESPDPWIRAQFVMTAMMGMVVPAPPQDG